MALSSFARGQLRFAYFVWHYSLFGLRWHRLDYFSQASRLGTTFRILRGHPSRVRGYPSRVAAHTDGMFRTADALNTACEGFSLLFHQSVAI